MLPRLAPVHPGTEVVRLRLGGTVPVRRIVAVVRAGSSGRPVLAHALASIREAAGTTAR